MMKTKNKKMSLIDHMNYWLNDYLPNVRNCSSETICSYTSALLLLMDFLEKEKNIVPENLNLDCFSKSIIEEWLVWLQNTHKNSKLSRDQRLAVVKSFFSYLRYTDNKYLFTYMSIIEIKGISHGRGKIVAPLSKKGIKVFFECIDCSTKTGKRDFAMFAVMYDIGCRVGEVTNIKLKDLHFEVDTQYVILHGKGDKIRTMVFSDDIATLLKRYIRMNFGESPDPQAYLFFSSHKGKYEKMSTDAINERLRIISQKAHEISPEVPQNMHSHQIRHSSATHWMIDNVNPAIISNALGHNSLSTTIRYLGVSKEEMKDAMMKRNIPIQKTTEEYQKPEGGLRRLIKIKAVK